MFKITSITIVNTGGSDDVFLNTDMPNTCTYPFTGHVTLKMAGAPGYTDNFLKQHFPDVPIELVVRDNKIDIRSKEI